VETFVVSVRIGELFVRDAASANATHNNTLRNAKYIFLILFSDFIIIIPKTAPHGQGYFEYQK
jgi:hypothetical protein